MKLGQNILRPALYADIFMYNVLSCDITSRERLFIDLPNICSAMLHAAHYFLDSYFIMLLVVFKSNIIFIYHYKYFIMQTLLLFGDLYVYHYWQASLIL